MQPDESFDNLTILLELLLRAPAVLNPVTGVPDLGRGIAELKLFSLEPIPASIMEVHALPVRLFDRANFVSASLAIFVR